MAKLIYKNIDFSLIGFSLGIVGTVYGMYLNFLFPHVVWSPIIMLISVFLSMNWRNFFRMKFPKKNDWLVTIVTFQIIMLLYAMFSGNTNAQNLSFHFFVIVYIIAIASCGIRKDFSNLAVYVFVLSLPLVFLGTFLTYMGLVSGELNYMIKQQNTDFPIEPFGVASGALTNFFAALCIKKRTLFQKLLFLFSFVCCCYIIISCTKRTPVFVMLVGSFFYLYKKKMINISNIPSNFKYIIGCIFILLICYYSIEYIQDKINDFFFNFTTGVRNLFGDNSVQDSSGSASMRSDSRKWAYAYIEHNFGILNYLFGGGYFVKWIDNPLLESYLDMGVIGLYFYMNIIVIKPLKVMLSKRSSSDLVIFPTLLCLHAILSILNSGHPYIWFKYTPVCLLSVVYLNTKTKHGKISVNNNHNS